MRQSGVLTELPPLKRRGLLSRRPSRQAGRAVRDCADAPEAKCMDAWLLKQHPHACVLVEIHEDMCMHETHTSSTYCNKPRRSLKCAPVSIAPTDKTTQSVRPCARCVARRAKGIECPWHRCHSGNQPMRPLHPPPSLDIINA